MLAVNPAFLPEPRNTFLAHAAAMMEHHTPVRSTKDAFLILDFTSGKTGDKQEWADWLRDEETDTPAGGRVSSRQRSIVNVLASADFIIV
jgi:hypothetical protein